MFIFYCGFEFIIRFCGIENRFDMNHGMKSDKILVFFIFFSSEQTKQNDDLIKRHKKIESKFWHRFNDTNRPMIVIDIQNPTDSIKLSFF